MNPTIFFLISFLFSITGVTGFAQSLSLSNQYGPIVPNGIIVQSGTPDSVKLNTYINVTNTTGNAINVLCKKQELYMLDSTQTFMCWSNFCYAPHVVISPNAQPIGAGETYTGFKGIYAQVKYNYLMIGESVVRWVFLNQDNPDDSVSVTVRYTTYPVGIGEEHNIDDLAFTMSPNPTAGAVLIGFHSNLTSAGTIQIQNMHGIAVLSQQVPYPADQISLDVSHLNNGVYLCSLLINGIRKHTQKFIIRH
jgi:hypothetical protein